MIHPHFESLETFDNGCYCPCLRTIKQCGPDVAFHGSFFVSNEVLLFVKVDLVLLKVDFAIDILRLM